MKTDAEVLMCLRERRKGKTKEQAAARASMSPTTARRYEQAAKLPSQLKQPRSYRTRSDPFADGRKNFTTRYSALMAHYGMQPTTNTPGEAHQNGDVEQTHYRFKQAVDQALHVRGHRDFPTRAAYLRFLTDLVRQRNLTRQTAIAEEQPHLRPLPALPLNPYQEFRLKVGPFSTIRVLHNTYSVSSRLIGHTLTVRVRAEVVELYHGIILVLTLPRLHGRQQHQIDYRHITWSLVRKPGACAQYRFRDALFPRLTFRKAYDALLQALPAAADQEYLRILHLAATMGEADVEAALILLLDQESVPTWEATRDLVKPPKPVQVPEVTRPTLNLASYDALLPSRCAHA